MAFMQIKVCRVRIYKANVMKEILFENIHVTEWKCENKLCGLTFYHKDVVEFLRFYLRHQTIAF